MIIKQGIVSAFGALAFGMSMTACALPVLDAKDAAVRIETAGKVMDIKSTAPNNVIKWVDFSIKGGKNRETVAFDNNNYLNYVTGHAASEIFGTLTGGGNIYIINPNGILIGDGAEVNVGNLYLSTQKLDNVQLDAFAANGTAPILKLANVNGDVVNLGHLKAMEVVVEGNVVKFKNVADIESSTENGLPTINVFAKTETRVGYDAASVDPKDYESLTTADWYALVKNEKDLQNMELDTNYMLARNMTVTEPFRPIGGNTGRYTGHFDGMGYEVKLQQILADGNRIGLFSAIGAKGFVENVGVITSKMDFSKTGFYNIYVGGVVGNNKGRLQNVWHKGCIQITASCLLQYVGGIAGSNSSGTITNAYNNGKILVSGATTWARVGGIAGEQIIEGTAGVPLIENAFNTGTINALGSALVGGIAGVNTDGNIRNVYNLGSVSSEMAAGGIVGRNDKNRVNDGTCGDVSFAYHARGSIDGTSKGAIVGVAKDENKGTFGHVFFAEKDAKGNSLSDAKGTSKSEAELKTAQTFFDDGWKNISAEGGAGKNWRIYDGCSMPLLTAFLMPKDNIRIVEYDGTRPVGTYGLDVPKSTKVPERGRVYDYVSDVTCVVPKEETGKSEPAEPSKPVDPPKPVEPPQPVGPSDPVEPPKPVEPSEPAEPPKPVGPPEPVDTTKDADIRRLYDGETIVEKYFLGREYEDTITALQQLDSKEQQSAPAAEANESERLMVAGTGVRLPDAMSAEELETMLSGTGEQESA